MLLMHIKRKLFPNQEYITILSLDLEFMKIRLNNIMFQSSGEYEIFFREHYNNNQVRVMGLQKYAKK